MKTLTVIAALPLLLLSLGGWYSPDKEAPPYPYVASSIDGRYYFKMLPGASEGSGAVFEVGQEDQKLWSVEGWYAFSTFLSSDGRHLVRLGNWPRGSEPSERDLAVAFYAAGEDGKEAKGIELKSYSTKELIKDVSKVRPTVSHYRFAEGRMGFVEPYSDRFELTTVDSIHYVFDITTGEIISKEKAGSR